MPRRRIVLMFAPPVVAAAGITAVLAHEGHAPPSASTFDLNAPRHVSTQTAAMIGLTTAEADFGSVEEILPLLGIVRAAPDKQQTLVARLSGTVAAVHKQVGDTVKKGDLLVELDSIDLMRDLMELEELDGEQQKLYGEMNQAESRIVDMQLLAKAANEQATLAEEELARLQASADAIPANQLSRKQGEVLQARTEQRRREIDLALARRLFSSLETQQDSMLRSVTKLRALISLAGYEWPDPANPGVISGTPTLRIRAGIDGVVTSRLINPGQGIEAGQAMIEIADFSSVQIEGELPESLAARLGNSLDHAVRARTTPDPNTPILGRVKFISPTVDPVKRTAHLIIEANNPAGALRPGAYVDIAVVLRANPEAVVVPRDAVLRDGPVHFVFLKDGDAFIKHDVVAGASDDRVIEIVDGLAPGDQVAVRGAYNLVMMRAGGGGGDEHAHEHEEDAKSSHGGHSH